MTRSNKALLEKIIKTCSVTGNELALRDLLIECLAPYGDITKTRWTGFYCRYGKEKNRKKKSPIKFLITAHMDSPGFIVREINEDGTLDIIHLGSPIKTKTANIRLMNVQGEIFPGILHHSSGKSRDGGYLGFFGFQSRNEVNKAEIKLGDSICFDSATTYMANKFIAAPHLDNRLGAYLLVDIAKNLKNVECDLYLAATGCEEMGGRDAQIIAEMVRPDIAICLDATYAQNPVTMGQGAVITLADGSTFLPPKLRDILSEIARKKKIPLQFEVYNYASTDARQFRVAPDGGCLAINLLIATLNNHTPHEIVSLKDLTYTRKMCLALLENYRMVKI